MNLACVRVVDLRQDNFIRTVWHRIVRMNMAFCGVGPL
jgi:hypothetical protein